MSRRTTQVGHVNSLVFTASPRFCLRWSRLTGPLSSLHFLWVLLPVCFGGWIGAALHSWVGPLGNCCRVCPRLSSFQLSWVPWFAGFSLSRNEPSVSSASFPADDHKQTTRPGCAGGCQPCLSSSSRPAAYGIVSVSAINFCFQVTLPLLSSFIFCSKSIN